MTPVIYRHKENGWEITTPDNRCVVCGGKCKIGPVPLSLLQEQARANYPGHPELYFFQVRQ